MSAKQMRPQTVTSIRSVKEDPKVRMHVKFESELDNDFGDKIAAVAFGEDLYGCIQCGNCSATCPLSSWMDYTPRRIIAMVREGFKDEVLNSYTIWLCASCYSCTVECPKEIHITDVMYALKREAIANKIHPKNFFIPKLADKFYGQVEKTGRNSELPVLIKLYAFSPLKMLKNAGLGWGLFSRGRMPLVEGGVKDRKSFKKYLDAVEKREGGSK